MNIHNEYIKIDYKSDHYHFTYALIKLHICIIKQDHIIISFKKIINASVSFRTVINLNFSGFKFLHILKAYVRIYQLANFRVLILLNLWIIADSNSVRTVLSPLEKHRSVINHAPRACAQVVSASCSHRRAYKSNTLNAYRTVINQSRSSICGGFTLRALGNNASNRHKGIRIRVLNVLVH